MKRMITKLLLASVFAFVACTTDSDDGDDFDAAVVCPADGSNKYGMPNRGTFIDERDGQEYKYTTIGDQVWMAQNLNYDLRFSMCYDNDSANCAIYGRLYPLLEKGKIGDNFDRDLADSACPIGWHLPTKTEWETMINLMGGFESEDASTRLRLPGAWDVTYKPEGTDVCGFSAFPSGLYYSGSFHYIESYLKFWTATLLVENIAYLVWVQKEMSIHPDQSISSIRCIMD